MPKGIYKKEIPRNWDRIQYEQLRRKVDPLFNELHDELSDCYYNYWKKGQSKPFVVGDKTFDVQDTPEKSKALFDKLHGLIFHLRDLHLHRENIKAGQPQDERLYREMTEQPEKEILRKKIGTDEQGRDKYEIVVGRDKSKLEKIQEWIQQRKEEGVEITDQDLEKQKQKLLQMGKKLEV